MLLLPDLAVLLRLVVLAGIVFLLDTHSPPKDPVRAISFFRPIPLRPTAATSPSSSTSKLLRAVTRTQLIRVISRASTLWRDRRAPLTRLRPAGHRTRGAAAGQGTIAARRLFHLLFDTEHYGEQRPAGPPRFQSSSPTAAKVLSLSPGTRLSQQRRMWKVGHEPHGDPRTCHECKRAERLCAPPAAALAATAQPPSPPPRTPGEHARASLAKCG